MAKQYYIKKDTTISGADIEWIAINGKEFYQLITSPAGKGRYFIDMDDFMIETNEEDYLDWRKEKNHSDYLHSHDPENPPLSFYAALVEHLRDAGPAYDADKLWNKNMVARILENTRYTGDGGFPAVISAEDFQRAQAQKKERTAPITKAPAQKELRRLCGGNPPKYVEGQVLGILNRLIAAPGSIQAPTAKLEDTAQAKILRQKLAGLLGEAPVDEDAARRTALALAAERLDAIGPEEYETERLRRVFRRTAPLKNLDEDLLHSSVRKIMMQKWLFAGHSELAG